ncbi:LOW QUALITY PROTEIN: arylacetamide deacetylase [Osmerus eperlanus]|uniref:LOW QUALITY PROTEIN: arylacetamide deacetylase n=1 Tax=Osmerus eperlanus TaxID=29151 RepID=UPI002E1610DD
MRLKGLFVLLSFGAFTAYYIYEPIPEDIEERWKLMLTNCLFRSLSHLADFSEVLGVKDYMGVMYFITFAERVVPVSDARVRVTEEHFEGVEVVVYQPHQQPHQQALRPAIIYLHGGGWCLGSSRMSPYDMLAREMVTELGAVVLSVEYRLPLACPPFPVPYEDVYRVVRYVLRRDVLARYAIPQGALAVSGTAARGANACSVSSMGGRGGLTHDSLQSVQLKVQALLILVLRPDLNTPSYQQNQNMPVYEDTKRYRFWAEYFSSDQIILSSMMTNTHNSPQSAPLLKLDKRSILRGLVDRKYNYSAPRVVWGGGGEASRWLADPRASPLLVPDAALRSLPKAYILTCEYDVLRDDGVMYVTRLRAAGVEVTHQHYPHGFHGALLFSVWPTDFSIARRMTENYIRWLRENL